MLVSTITSIFFAADNGNANKKKKSCKLKLCVHILVCVDVSLSNYMYSAGTYSVNSLILKHLCNH